MKVSSATPADRRHFPGSVPGTTALRVLLAHAGIRAPHTGQPFSEAMLFGIAGGIGVGVTSFYYEKEDFASIFLAGRHKWFDDLDYLTSALAAFAIHPEVRESSGAGPAARQLAEVLAECGPCVAWVDSAHLPHRAVPEALSGGGYHVVTVYEADPEKGEALIGDLTDDPVSISLPELAKARLRIKKQKNRLLAVPRFAKGSVDLSALVRGGLRACRRELLEPSMKAMRRSFQVEAIRLWGERMHGSEEKESWERVFRPGPNLWRGLTSIYQFIEHYGTGGGLCRPLFADFLREAGEVEPALLGLAGRCAELGQAWSALAEAALPDDVPMLREAKEQMVRRAELMAGGGPVEEVRAAWSRLGDLGKRAAEAFPLSAAECTELRRRLKGRILTIYKGEAAAQAALGEIAGAA